MSQFTVPNPKPASPVCLERDTTSITLIWESVKVNGTGTVTYELQISEAERERAHQDSAWTTFKTLSSILSTNSVRKKNLLSSLCYKFRIRYKTIVGSIITQSDFSDSSKSCETLESGVIVLEPPVIVSKDSESVTLKWQDAITQENGTVIKIEGAKLRYRLENVDNWSDIGGGKLITGNQVKKKNLLQKQGYHFSLLPVFAEDGKDLRVSWSLSTPVVFLSSISENMARLMPTQLRKGTTLIDAKDALADKSVILIYFSAHWCNPCKAFTPRLAELYREAKAIALGKSFEIVFCSADHDSSEFESYYAQQPWLAIPYDSDEREKLMGMFSVSGIPQLTAIDRNTKILEHNATQSVSMEKLRVWVSSS